MSYAVEDHLGIRAETSYVTKKGAVANALSVVPVRKLLFRFFVILRS